MTIVERVKSSREQRETAIENALVESFESAQLPTRFEEDNDGTVRIFFTYGAVWVGRWDHSGERATFVGSWFTRARFDA